MYSLENINKIKTTSHEKCSNTLKIFNDVDLSPTSGYEPEYQPEYWNAEDKLDSKKVCYHYALNIKMYPKGTDKKFMFSNISKEILECKSVGQVIDLISSRIKEGGRTFEPILFKEKCPDYTYKICLAVYYINSEEGTNIEDVHFYRQNPNGAWSHKRKYAPITDKDICGDYINNPEVTERDFIKNNNIDWKVDFVYFAVGTNEKRFLKKKEL